MQQVSVGLLAMLACGVGISPGPVAAAQVRLLYGPGSPQVEFACGEIRAALKSRGEYGCGLSPSAVDGASPLPPAVADSRRLRRPECADRSGGARYCTRKGRVK